MIITYALFFLMWGIILAPFAWVILQPDMHAWKNHKIRGELIAHAREQGKQYPFQIVAQKQTPTTYTCQTCGLTSFNPIGVCLRCNANDGH